MILVVDEIVNASSSNCVQVLGMPLNWFDLPARIAQAGPQAWQMSKLYDCIIAPSSGPQSLGPGWKSNWPTYEFGAALTAFWAGPDSDAPFKYGLYTAPSFNAGGNSWLSGVWLHILREDGSSVLTVIDLIAYATRNALPATAPLPDRTLRISETEVISGLNLYSGGAFPSLGHALRISSWALAKLPGGHDFNLDWLLWGRGAAEFCVPDWMGKPVTQTLLIADTSSTAVQLDEDYQFVTPTSPILHISLVVDETVLVSRRGTYDFTGVELTYVLTEYMRKHLSFFDWRAMVLATVKFVFKEFLPGPEGFFADQMIDEGANRIFDVRHAAATVHPPPDGDP